MSSFLILLLCFVRLTLVPVCIGLSVTLLVYFMFDMYELGSVLGPISMILVYFYRRGKIIEETKQLLLDNGRDEHI